MNENNFLEHLKELVHYTYNATSLQVLILSIGKYMGPIAEELRVGKITFSNIPPSGQAMPEMERRDVPMYMTQEDCLEEGVKEFHFPTQEGGELIFHIFPVSELWDSEQETDLRLLAEVMYMIVSRCKMAKMVDYYMVTDRLTGISNVAGLHQHIGKLIADGSSYQYTGMHINIKNFRYINQVAGATNGDKMLKKFSRLLDEQMEDTEIAARAGGDNFMVVVKNVNTGRCLNFLENLEIPLMVDGEERVFKVNCRVGIYAMKTGDTVADMMTYTNAALQKSKQLGQNDVIRFHPSMLKKINHDKDVVQSFPKALLAREFQVYYQPKVDMSTGKMIGSEALARWIRNGKVVPPMEFVPSLEEDGSICQLDFYILEQVCRSIRRWLNEGIEPVPVSVNFSRMHFHNRNVGYDILDVLERFDVDPKYIEVEMTEMYGYENYGNMLKFIALMTESGIRVSVDDFGTGYSSLAMISNLNADTIKIDKSFLDKTLDGTDKDRLLVKDIIGMIQDMNIGTIAEGVETKEQMKFLKEMGCSTGQGYLFDKPLPQEEYEERQKNPFCYKIHLT